MIKVKKISREKLSTSEKFYLLQILNGMKVTFRHMFFNLVHLTKNYVLGQESNHPDINVLEYPEKKKVMPKGYRGKHRLTQREDGTPRCVACMMCATACPADCIHIDAAEHENPDIEKYPAKFDIDLLRCIYCGYCVEACPCDAIRMDSGINTIFSFKREDFVIHKDELLQIKPQYKEDLEIKSQWEHERRPQSGDQASH